MSKKLNIIEAMKMPIGTEFKVIQDGFGANVQKAILDTGCYEKFLRWEDGDELSISSQDVFATFIPIQQPVSFMEVVNSDKQCKVDFSNINLPIEYKSRISMFKDSDYRTFGNLIFDLSNKCGSDVLRKIIKEGKWYIEESEELEDERLS